MEANANIYSVLRMEIIHNERWLSSAINDFMNGYPVTWQQYYFLTVLRDHPDKALSTKSISSYMPEEGTDISRLSDRVVGKGYARKRKHPKDKRQVQISITYEGLKLIAQIEDSMHYLDNMMNNLNSDEINEFIRLSLKLRT